MERSPDIDITGDPWLDLLGAIVGRAVRDARAGNRAAAYWLWEVAPEWAGPAIDGAKRTGGPRPREKTRQGMNRRLERSTAVVEPCRERGHRTMNDYTKYTDNTDYAAEAAKVEQQKEERRRADAAHNASLMQSILADAQKRGELLELEAKIDLEAATGASHAQQKEEARRAFVAAGGDPVLFDGEWPTLRAEIIRQRTVTAMATAPAPSDLVSQWIGQRNRG